MDVDARACRTGPAGPARLWFGLALITLAGMGEAAASESLRLPAGSDSFIGRDPPLEDAWVAAEPATVASTGSASWERRSGAGQNRPGAMSSEALRAGAAPAAGSPARALPADASVHARSLDGFSNFAEPPVGPTGRAQGTASLFAADDPFGLQDFTLQELAPRDFRGRSRSLNETEGPLKPEDSLMDDRGTWQRLASEYRAQRRVRVLTLWDAGWSSLSLQAGKHGDPSLQWTGHLFGHSEVRHGVFDRWMPPVMSAGGAAGRGVVHALSPPATSKSAAALGSRLSNAIP
jgi:hypothetical protein